MLQPGDYPAKKPDWMCGGNGGDAIEYFVALDPRDEFHGCETVVSTE